MMTLVTLCLPLPLARSVCLSFSLQFSVLNDIMIRMMILIIVIDLIDVAQIDFNSTLTVLCDPVLLLISLLLLR